MIKLIRSTFYDEKRTIKQLCEFISSAKYLSLSNQCEKFEKNFAKFQERKYCIMFNSGSSANLALIQALLNLGKIKKGDMAAFSAVTWSTNVMPLIQHGLEAVPIDVELDTLNISSEKLLSTIKKYPIKLLFLTNLLGFCGDVDKIERICKKNKIILLEDNCESLGTVYMGKKLGNFSLASTFSFYVGHHMPTIEGGAVCTDDEELYVMLHLARAHGWDRHLDTKNQNRLRKRYEVNSFYSLYTFYDLGYNLRPTEITGFIGNIQLSHIDKIVKKRNSNFKKIATVLYQQVDKYYHIKFDHIDFISNFAVPVICKSVAIKNQLIKMCQNKIEVRPIIGGDISKQPFFKKYMPTWARLLDKSNSSIIHRQGLYFGNNPDLTEQQIDTIIRIFTSKARLKSA